MSRQERQEQACKDRKALVPLFAQAFGQDGLKAAQNELFRLKRSCPQRGSQYEMAFRETLEIAKKGTHPVV